VKTIIGLFVCLFGAAGLVIALWFDLRDPPTELGSPRAADIEGLPVPNAADLIRNRPAEDEKEPGQLYVQYYVLPDDISERELDAWYDDRDLAGDRWRHWQWCREEVRTTYVPDFIWKDLAAGFVLVLDASTDTRRSRTKGQAIVRAEIRQLEATDPALGPGPVC
jgi:hypothetical protein